MIDHRVEANWGTLLDQAKGTAEDYFIRAQRVLAASELKFTAADVIALAQIMAQDFAASCRLVAMQNLCDEIECFTQSVTTAIEDFTNMLGEK